MAVTFKGSLNFYFLLVSAKSDDILTFHFLHNVSPCFFRNYSVLQNFHCLVFLLVNFSRLVIYLSTAARYMSPERIVKIVTFQIIVSENLN